MPSSEKCLLRKYIDTSFMLYSMWSCVVFEPRCHFVYVTSVNYCYISLRGVCVYIYFFPDEKSGKRPIS